MRPFYAIVVFILVALVYSHLVQEFAPSSVPGGGAVPAEVYELDYSDPATFHDTCRVRHPVVILDPPAYPSSIPTRQECMRRFPQQTLYVKHRQDYPLDVEGIDVRFDTAMPGMFSTPVVASEGVTDASRSPYFTENNGNGFLRETGIDRTLAEEGDAALAPPMTSYRAYDWMTGGAGATTPLRYHTYSRRYWRVIEGPSVRIKLIPWTYTRQLHERRDYDAYEFFSEVDVWDPAAGEPNHTHAADLARITASRGIAEIELHCGQMLYLPPYWWYSVQYPSAGTVMVEHTYATYMNRLANLGDLGRHWLQRYTSYTALPPATRASRKTETVLESEPNSKRDVDVEPESTTEAEPLDIPL